MQRCRPLIIGPGEPPYLIGRQSKITKHMPERLAGINGGQELLPHLYREPVQCSRSPVTPQGVVVRLAALPAAASVRPPGPCPMRNLRTRSKFCGVADLA